MVERGEFNPGDWYSNLIDIASKPSVERYSALHDLHKVIADEYIEAVLTMSPFQAAESSSDGRSRALVVGHILAWEEWQVQVFSDPGRQERVEKQLQLQDYFDPEECELRDFSSVDDFNHYQAQKYATWDWGSIQAKAISTARRLQSYFPKNPDREWIEFLDGTPLENWKITPDKTISIPGGWYLWMVTLEHEAVEHRGDLFF